MIVKGKRLDGRKLDEIRPLEAEVGVIKRAQGSAMFAFGKTRALAGVYGPRPMHPKGLQDPTKTILRCKYFMAPFSTSDRIRPGRSRRATEISKVIKEALSQVVFFEDFPKTATDVFMDVIQADASTRCAALNAASMALAEAGTPMRDLVSCIAVGKIDGKLVMDVAGIEDNYGDVDVAVATVGGGDKFVLLQMDGVISMKEFPKVLELAKKGCAEIHAKQKQALLRRYSAEEVLE